MVVAPQTPQIEVLCLSSRSGYPLIIGQNLCGVRSRLRSSRHGLMSRSSCADDASTDETAEVVRSFGDRVRYHLNPQNIGYWPNFARLTELACGDFFSWLQDDDVVHRDFARRATQALSAADDIAVYAAFEVDGPSATAFIRPELYGPPIALNWMRSELRFIDGSIVAPLSFFVSFANPPAVAFRTNVIRKAVQYSVPECALLNERIVLTQPLTGPGSPSIPGLRLSLLAMNNRTAEGCREFPGCPKPSGYC